MSSSDRQSRLLANQDWKRIYQSFRNADFQSYDFDNLRRTMINYLRQNYPEDFNDYIESSEYLALIDLIAFLGQNLSFRIDLNARENFLETAERRESVLRLARLLSYNPKRNQAANGLLKFETIKTTEEVQDSTGLNLAGTTVKWNDSSNKNYFEQFIKIINSALPVNGTIGRPNKTAIIAGVSTEQYRFSAIGNDIPVYPFSKSVEGITTQFEVVSTDIQNESIVEEPPFPGNSPAFLYRDDGQGSGSTNTGFFMHFRQGKIENGNFQIQNPTANQVVAIDSSNINDTDVWLYSVDGNGSESVAWAKLEAVTGNNVIYNSLFKNFKNVFSVTTRIDDRINLVFSDGVFGNLPSGNFKIYYRTSANRTMLVNPGDIRNVIIEIPYVSKSNTYETLTIGLSLKYSVGNSKPSETNDSIKQNAPATYYTQNRLITAEDYNIGPLAVSQDVIKTKSVNRVSSGISRYFDLKDASGKYSNTSLFADDGILYKEEYQKKFNFTFATQTDIEGIILNTIEPILGSVEMKNYYMAKFAKVSIADLNITWKTSNTFVNRTTGIFENANMVAQPVSTYTTGLMRLVEVGAMCKFAAPAGFVFDKLNNLVTETIPATYGTKKYAWTSIISITGNGTAYTSAESSAILLNDFIPTGSKLLQVLPKFSTRLIDDIKIDMIDRTYEYRDFALRYDIETRSWKIIIDQNINTVDSFSTGKAGDTNGQYLDSSWLLYFKTNGETYTVTYRNIRYVFESQSEIKFLFNGIEKIYNPETGKIVKDKIRVLNINRQYTSTDSFSVDYDWAVTGAYKNVDGYLDPRKILVKFYDDDYDGIIDNPEIFEDIVPLTSYIFEEKYTTSDRIESYKYVDNENQAVITTVATESQLSAYRTAGNDGKVFYIEESEVFKQYSGSTYLFIPNNNYKVYVGRDKLKFHYVHVADSNFRIDPSASNIIDTYLLTRLYDTEYRKYLSGASTALPLPPSTDELYRSYGSSLNAIKSISDEIVFHPVKYKPLFGNKAESNLQVTFKIVKNTDVFINNNELKADVITAINQFFSIDNWDFGDTFYFQELSAYIMNMLSPRLVSIVIVPNQSDLYFGSLFEIKSESDEIFINSAQVSEVEIIDQITQTQLQASGKIITSSTTSNTGIQSSNLQA